MTGKGDTLLDVDLPGILPDNRVIAGQLMYGGPLEALTGGATFVRGIVSGLDPGGVKALETLAKRPELKRLLLVIAVYGGSRTWGDVLGHLLTIQGPVPGKVEFRVLARRNSADRPANLLWVQSGDGDIGHAVAGNVGNLLRSAHWDPTDAVLAFRLEPAMADVLRKWFDGLYVRSAPLTKATAAAPELHLPEGNEEGQRRWKEYLDVLNRREQERGVEPVINPTTGEVESAAEPAPSKRTDFPQPDSVLREVQTVLARGSVVALDVASRAPPLSAPVKAEFFGERAETRQGAARRQQSFRVSVFDDDVARRLGARRGAMTDRLAACSLMLRDGVRWVPDVADDLLQVKFDVVEREAVAALKDATGGRSAEAFVEASLQRIATDCEKLANQIAPGRKPPADLVDRVKKDLMDRLRKNLCLKRGMAPSVSRSRFQIVASETDREGPWDLVQTFLTTAARLPREVATHPGRVRGLKAKPEDLIAAFNVFQDPLVARFREKGRVEYQARRELALIDEIEEHPTATPKQRAYALFRLIKGEGDQAALAELPEEKAPDPPTQTEVP